MSTQRRPHPKHIHGRPQPEWFVNAACRETDVDSADFHPEDRPNRDTAIERAKNVCASCPVSPLCHEYGDAVSPAFGIFGGLTATERKRRIERSRQARSAA